ncbi:MAG TPA: hypothetical protein VII01_00880 [Solirubrobacteraceae bacterium]
MTLTSTTARAEELARRWMAALVMERPLDVLGELPLEALALQAPALCEQVIRALQSEVELDRLTGQGAPTGRESSALSLRLAAMAGVRDAGDAVAAVEALRGVLWEVLLVEGEAHTARDVADLADRLAHVCAVLAAAAMAALPQRAAPDSETEGSPLDAKSQEHAQQVPAVIVDEHRGEPAGAPQPPAQTSATVSAKPASPERSPSWDESPPVPPRTVERRGPWEEPERPQTPEIEIRDERVEAGPAAWIGSISRELARHREDGRPFAVLLLEPAEMERLRGAGAELEVIDEALGRVLSAALEDSRAALTRQSAGRYWIVAATADRVAADALAERLATAAAQTIDGRGRRLQIALGTAVCPEDGRDAPTLAAHADVSLYAARSATRLGRGHAIVDEPA